MDNVTLQHLPRPSTFTVGNHQIAASADEKRGNGSTIIFTGNRRKDHYEVVVRGESVELPLACLKALVDLVLARAGSRQGFVQQNSVTIFRLRHAIDVAVGVGAGKSLIETGTSDEYRLTIQANELGDHVAISPCFSELVKRKVISRQAFSCIRDMATCEIVGKS